MLTYLASSDKQDERLPLELELGLPGGDVLALLQALEEMMATYTFNKCGGLQLRTSNVLDDDTDDDDDDDVEPDTPENTRPDRFDEDGESDLDE